MEYKLFQNNVEDARTITKYLLTVCASLLLVILALLFLCISISHRQMAVLVPMNLNAPLMVSNNSVSSQYLTETALSFIDLRLNFDPDTIDGNHALILRSIAPSDYSAIKKSLDEETTLVKKQSLSSSFYINGISVNKKMLAVLVHGTLARSVGDKNLSLVKTDFQIDFKNDNGLLLVTQFFEVKTA